jgi:hypothetical protein
LATWEYEEWAQIGRALATYAAQDKANKKTNTSMKKTTTSMKNRPPTHPRNPMVQKLLSAMKNRKNKAKSIREIARGITEDDEKKAKSIETQARRYLRAMENYRSANKTANT